MTTKRSKRERRKKVNLLVAPQADIQLDFPVAPRRKPDTADLILAKVRENTAVVESTKPCLRCGKVLTAEGFAREEWRKVRPTCLACAATPLRKTPQWVKAADVLPAPSRPLSGLTALRKRIADEAAEVAKAEEDAAADEAIHRAENPTEEEITANQKFWLEQGENQC